MHTHKRPYLIVAATPLNLKMTAPDGQSFTEKLKPGDFHWVDFHGDARINQRGHGRRADRRDRTEVAQP
jgi:hypothetical protein